MLKVVKYFRRNQSSKSIVEKIKNKLFNIYYISIIRFTVILKNNLSSDFRS